MDNNIRMNASESPLTPPMPDSPSPPVAPATPLPSSLDAHANRPKPTVIRNSFLALGAGCITGAVVGAYKQLPPGPTAAGMGSMWGAIGFTYFLSRAQLSKYLAEAEQDTFDPAPVPSSRHQTIARPPPPAALHDRHTLLASIGAGAITGSLSTLIVYGRRPAVLVPATLLAATGAGVAQSAYTWARHTRQDVLLWKYRTSGGEEDLEAMVSEREGKQQGQPSFVTSVKAQVRDVLVNTKWLPVRMLTDNEYLRSLSGQVAQVEGEVAKYERVMERLKERIRQLEEGKGEDKHE